jgi:soluble lytic murein transglycosylase-like protein
VIRCIVYALAVLYAIASWASDAPVSNDSESPKQNSLVDLEKQVRAVAERSAAEEKARKEQERLAKANDAPSLKVFKYKKNGTVVFADTVPFKTQYQVIVYSSCYACTLNSNVDWFNTRLHLTEFADTISNAANTYRVDPALIRAVIHAESAFNPLARSSKGATGLMQLMPGTAQDMGVSDSTNAHQNIQGGVKYLSYLLETFNGNQTLAVAAYNAGPKAVARYNGIPPFEETQTYVKRVNILLMRYKKQMVVANN